jgi:hypothetical protein
MIESPSDKSPPSAWYYSVNRLLGWCWVMDRYIPLLGNPLVEWVHRLFYRNRVGK